MKNNYRRINALFKMIDMELFYVISIGPYSNSLQANYNSGLSLKLTKLKFKSSVDADVNGFVNFNRGNIAIVLT